MMQIHSAATRHGFGLLAAALIWLLASTCQAYFFDYGAGTRPAGLGQAFVAVADDVNTINWNPAGLATLDRYEVTTMYASLFAGLNARLYTGQTDQLGYNFVAAAVPIDETIGSFGASWNEFSSLLYHENTFTLGYARTVAYDIFRAQIGANLKILNWSVEGTDYSEPLSKTGFTGDVAILYPLPGKFTVGACLENLIPADMGVTDTEVVPRNFRMGVSWKQDLEPRHSIVDSLLVSTEYVNRDYMQNKNTVAFGAESWFFKHALAARMGVNSTEFTVSFSGRYTFEQLNRTEIQLDYSFSLPFYVQQTAGTHRISLTASWGMPKESKVEQAEKVLAESLTTESEDNLAQKRDHELDGSRSGEEANLKAMLAKLRAEIAEVQAALNDIEARIKSGDLPPIAFEPGKSVVAKSSLRTLDAVGGVLEKHPDVKLRVEGHTDKSGSSKANLALSQERVEVVREYLITLYKLRPENLIPVGYGDTRPIADNRTAEGKVANRRVEFKVLIPSGFESEPAAAKPQAEAGAKKEQVRPEDIVPYEDLDKMREKLKVYKMQMNPDEVEEIFQQQHQASDETGGKSAPQKGEAAAPAKFSPTPGPTQPQVQEKELKQP